MDIQEILEVNTALDIKKQLMDKEQAKYKPQKNLRK